jgi:hypothetical protein
MFVASSVGFLGMAGFGMEVSTWYLVRRHGQNTADAAAIAGVLQLVQKSTDYNGAQTAGSDVATANGYKQGLNQAIVKIEPGNYSGGAFSADPTGTCSTTCNAVKATVIREVPRSFTALILGKGTTNVGEVATAALEVMGPACSLALDGGLTFSGNAAVTAKDCLLASNRKDKQSIFFNGAGNQKKQASAVLVGAGGCDYNGGVNPCLGPGNMMYQPPTTDPYLALQTDTPTIPSAVKTNCTSAATADPYAPYTVSLSPNVLCVGSNLSVKNNSGPKGDGNVTLPTGTYYFYKASINVSGGSLTCPGCTIILYDGSLSISGGSVTCNGCTIVFTGSAANKLGNLKITGGFVDMSAPKTSTYLDSNYNGVLFYMDAQYAEHKGSCGVGNTPVSIQGSSNITLNGGMYFPNASVCVTGSAFSGTTSCLSLVAWSIEYNGGATENLTGCSKTGTNTANVEAVNLVQ